MDSLGAPGAERVRAGRGAPSPAERSGEGTRSLPRKLLLFHLKMEYFDSVFKPDLTEETMTQLQEEEAIASSCLILSTPMEPDDSLRTGLVCVRLKY